MSELKEIARITCKRLRKETKNAKIVFYQSNGRWSSYYFWIKANSVLELADRNFLELIQQDDPKAVIVDVDDFVEANGDGSILVDDMVSSVLYLYDRGQANINDFLDYYANKEVQQDVMTIKEIIKIMEKRLKQLADWEMPETVNGNSISAEMLEIAKFLIEVKKQRLDWEE